MKEVLELKHRFSRNAVVVQRGHGNSKTDQDLETFCLELEKFCLYLD